MKKTLITIFIINSFLIVFFLVFLAEFEYKRKVTLPDGRTYYIHRSFFITNRRELIIGNAYFEAFPIEGNYKTFEIGTPEDVYNGKPEMILKLPDGEEISPTNPEDVKYIREKYADDLRQPGYFGYRRSADKRSQNKSNSDNEIYDYGIPKQRYQRWPEGSQKLNVGAWDFIINKDKILRIECNGYWSTECLSMPAIAFPPDTEFTGFPLTEDKIIKHFGAPNEAYEYLTVF